MEASITDFELVNYSDNNDMSSEVPFRSVWKIVVDYIAPVYIDAKTGKVL